MTVVQKHCTRGCHPCSCRLTTLPLLAIHLAKPNSFLFTSQNPHIFTAPSSLPPPTSSHLLCVSPSLLYSNLRWACNKKGRLDRMKVWGNDQRDARTELKIFWDITLCSFSFTDVCCHDFNVPGGVVTIFYRVSMVFVWGSQENFSCHGNYSAIICQVLHIL